MEEKKSMSRRDALKTMGAIVASAALATTGLSSLSSCTDRQKKRLVFYFTATGNSLYIARQLASEGNEPLSIPQLLKNRQLEFEADEIGIVYPIYGHMPPNMVKEFLQTAKLKANYLFCVPTFGARKCSAVEIWDNLAKTCGYKFDYICTLMMVDNWLHAFDMNEQMKMDKHIPEQLTKIQEDIAAHRQWHEPTTQEERDMHAGFMQFSGLNERDAFLMSASERFLIEGNCIECGICIQVCPRGNYKLTSRGITANGQCDYCLACIHACPQKAIQFRPSENPLLGPERNPKARYRNEHVSLMDIKRANDQH